MRALLRLATLGLLLALGTAGAHVPDVGGGPKVIDEPGRSWAFYEDLAPGDTHVWTFDLAAGDPLFLQVAVPVHATWRPDARLTGPDGPIALVRADDIGLEPFTPYASRAVWGISHTAPTTGRYRLEVSGEGGPYGLGYGLAESFSAGEWTTIPVQTLRIRAWEGATPWLILAPYALGVALPMAMRAARTARPPLLLTIASGLFLGSAVDRLFRMTTAVAFEAQAGAGAWVLAGVLVVPSLLLAVAAWRGRRTITLAVIGAAGLLLWSGLLLGPALVLAAALARVSVPSRPGHATRP